MEQLGVDTDKLEDMKTDDSGAGGGSGVDGSNSLGLWASRNAVSFYEAQGHERVMEHNHEYQDGIELTLVEMEKQLIP
ncbi:Acetyltransferase (GNAT) family [Halapricum desulfuricans]|uniref:Acetyltransferase (GNAT) family n=1 Tax=Halapricum desulfuricans TaxID=2841257 RepID=A0A897N5W9_9EURY|nr:Acetyltransferase (GNAT) family [Halapricum desulfuricans]